MAVVVTIDGVNKTLNVFDLSYGATVKNLNQLTFRLRTFGGTYRPVKGREVTITENSVLRWGGSIYDLEETMTESGAEESVILVTCQDHNALIDRCVVNGVFPTGSHKSMLEIAKTSFLTDFGVTLDPSQEEGPSVAAMTLPVVWLRDVLNTLDTLAGTIHRIDQNKVLSARAIGSFVAPFNINTTLPAHPIRDIRVRNLRHGSGLKYANRVWVTAGGSGAQEVKGELHWGDGTSKTFRLDVTCNRQQPFGPKAITSSSVATDTVLLFSSAHGFVSGDKVTIADHVGSTPDLNGEQTVTVVDSMKVTIPIKVTVAGAGGTATALPNVKSIQTNRFGVLSPQLVGVFGVDTMPWTYDAATNSLVQSSAETTLAVGEYVDVNYIGTFPIIIMVQNVTPEQINNGLWETIATTPNMLLNDARVYGSSVLNKSIQQPKEIIYRTLESGLEPAQVQIITIPELGLPGSVFLISNIKTDLNQDHILDHEITAVEGSFYNGSWQDIYAALRGEGGSSGSVSAASAGGSVGISSGGGEGASVGGASKLSRFLGGSALEGVSSPTTPTGTTWLSAAHGARIIKLPNGTSGVVSVSLRVGRSAGVSVKARLQNVTNNTTIGTSALHSSTSWGTYDFAVTTEPGSSSETRDYELQLQPGGAANESVYGMGDVVLDLSTGSGSDLVAPPPDIVLKVTSDSTTVKISNTSTLVTPSLVTKTASDSTTVKATELKSLFADPPLGGTVYHVPADGDLQSVLNAVSNVNGAEIWVTPGTYTGNFILPVKTLNPGAWIVIRPDTTFPEADDLALPWITPAYASSMIKLQALDTFTATLRAADGAHNYWMVGLEGLPNTAHPDRDMFEFGDTNMTSYSQMPYNIGLDRCYLHGHPTSGQHRGVLMNVAWGYILHSYFEKFIEVGRDSQAIACLSGSGPITIDSNYVEATGENCLFGGNDPHIDGLVPADITVTNNWFNKPIEWQSTFPGSVKNLFELKSARRVLIEGNIFSNSWIDAQAGHGVVLTIRDQDGGATYTTIEDVTFRNNVILNCAGAFINLLGLDYLHPSLQGTNMVIQGNYCVGAAMGVQSSSGFQPTTLRHNSFLNLVYKSIQFAGDVMPSGNFVCKDNVFAAAEFAIAGEGTGLGLPTLEHYAPGYDFQRNVIEHGSTAYSYPANNVLKSNGSLAALIDGSGNYTGGEASSDGPIIGANVTALRSLIWWWDDVGL